METIYELKGDDHENQHRKDFHYGSGDRARSGRGAHSEGQR